MLLTLAAFHASLQRTQDATAVQLGSQALTYAALARRSDGMAAALLRAGVAAGDAVAILTGRCPAAIVALLAIDKLGAAAVPIDPAHPADRVDAVLAEVRPRIVIASPEWPAGADAKLLATDGLAETWDAGGGVPTIAADPERIAILSFTSGSTGRPKGVELTARNLAAGARAWRHDVPDAGGRTLMFGGPGFITTHIEYAMTLLDGGTIVMVDEATRRDPEALLDLLDAQRVTRAFLAASPLLALAEAAALRPRPLALRHLMTGAEPLRVSPALRAFARALPGMAFFNTHGSTEAGAAFRYRMPADPTDWPATPPMGEPWPGVTGAVLGPDLAPVPRGGSGELVIQSAGVARGYWNQPALTADRFVADLPGLPPGRAFRNGDLVRQLADGAFHWIGRIDDQIKIGGNRIEPAEVEAVLMEHPAVGETAVAAQPDPAGSLRLVGFVVPRTGHPAPEPASLAAHLATRLPAPMVPALWAILPALPRLPGGKLDRGGLPHVVAAATAAGRPPTRPREIELARMVSELLGGPISSAEDDFFSIGGDSVRALQLIALAHRNTLRLTLRDVFECRTVAAMAARIDGVATRADEDVHLVPLTGQAARQGVDTPVLFFIHAVGGMVFNYVPIAMRLPEYRCYGVQARGMEPGETPEVDFDTMVDSYARAIRTMVPDGPYRIFGYSFGGVIGHALLRRLRTAPHPDDLLIIGDSFDPADPGPQPQSFDDVLMSGLEPVRPRLARLVRPLLGLMPMRAKLLLGRRSIRQFLAGEQEALAFQHISSDLVARIVGVWLAGSAMTERLQCQPFAARATLLRAKERVYPDEADPVAAWRALVGELTVRDVPGNHFTMLSPANLPAVMSLLRDTLGLAPAPPFQS